MESSSRTVGAIPSYSTASFQGWKEQRAAGSLGKVPAGQSGATNFQNVPLGSGERGSDMQSVKEKMKKAREVAQLPVVENTLRVVGIVFATGLCMASVFSMASHFDDDFACSVLSFWSLMFSVIMVFVELRHEPVLECLEFCKHYIGRGAFYIFVGVTTVSTGYANLLIGLCIIVIGVVTLMASPSWEWPTPPSVADHVNHFQPLSLNKPATGAPAPTGVKEEDMGSLYSKYSSGQYVPSL